MAERLLEVKGLKVRFTTEDGIVRAVDGVSFELDRGSVFGIVGESGSGKSVTAMTILGLTRDKNTTFEGEVIYKGQNLLALPESRLRDVRGNEIAMIFQDPMTSLNPVYKVGDQIIEAITTHEDVSKSGAKRRAVELDRALDPRVLRAGQAHDRLRGDALARARLADDRQHFAGGEVEGDAVDRLHAPVFGGEADAEVGDGEELLPAVAHAAEVPSRIRGSR